VDIRKDSSILLNIEYFDYITGQRICRNRKLEHLFGISKQEPEIELNQVCMNLAFAIQQVTGDIVLLMSVTARRLTGSYNLTIAGGVTLNWPRTASSYGRIFLTISGFNPFRRYALGAAYAAWHIGQNRDRKTLYRSVCLQGSYFGPEFGQDDIKNSQTIQNNN
jgi:carbamoyltransferase